jgi:hypothetical protein
MSEQVTALWVRINEINCELEALSAPAALVSDGARLANESLAAWLRRDNERRCESARHREERAATLRLELKELRAKLPPEGMASGQRLVIYRGLGEMILRDDPEPEFAQVNVPRDDWDWSET